MTCLLHYCFDHGASCISFFDQIRTIHMVYFRLSLVARFSGPSFHPTALHDRSFWLQLLPTSRVSCLSSCYDAVTSLGLRHSVRHAIVTWAFRSLSQWPSYVDFISLLSLFFQLSYSVALHDPTSHHRSTAWSLTRRSVNPGPTCAASCARGSDQPGLGRRAPQ